MWHWTNYACRIAMLHCHTETLQQKRIWTFLIGNKSNTSSKFSEKWHGISSNRSDGFNSYGNESACRQQVWVLGNLTPLSIASYSWRSKNSTIHITGWLAASVWLQVKSQIRLLPFAQGMSQAIRAFAPVYLEYQLYPMLFLWDHWHCYDEHGGQ